MTCNNDLNIKEINNLKWANKLGTSFKKIGLEAFCIKGNAQAPLINNYSINSAKWTYDCGSFPELPGALRVQRENDSVHRHGVLISIFPSNLVCARVSSSSHSTSKVGPRLWSSAILFFTGLSEGWDVFSKMSLVRVNVGVSWDRWGSGVLLGNVVCLWKSPQR